MDIAKLGVAIDPTKTVEGSRRVQAELKQLGNQAKTELGKIDAAATKNGRSITDMGRNTRAGFGNLTRGLLEAGNAFGLMNSPMGQLVNQAQSAVQATGALRGSIGGMGGVLAVAVPLVIAAGVAIAGLGIAYKALATGFPLAAKFEQDSVAIETLTGSAERTKKLMGDLAALGAKTPLETPELIGAARSLLAFGESGNDVVETLRKIGDVSQAVQAPIGEIATLYGKARVQGTLFAEDINQLTGRGIPIIQIFADQLGVSTSKVKEMGSEGKITFSNLERAFNTLTDKGGKFHGMMAKQSETWTGKVSTLSDTWNGMLRDMAAPVQLALKPALDDLIAGVNQMTPAVVEFGTQIGAALANFNANLPATKAELQGMGVGWTELGRTIAAMWNEADRLIREFSTSSGETSNAWEIPWRDVFTRFPQNVKFMLELSGVYFNGFIAKAQEAANTIKNAFAPDASGHTKAGEFFGDMVAPYLMNEETMQKWQAIKDRNALARSEAAYGTGSSAALNGNAGTTGGQSIDDQIQSQIDDLIRQNDEINRNQAAWEARAQAIRDATPQFGQNGFGVLPGNGVLAPPEKTPEFNIPKFLEPKFGNPGFDPTAGVPKAKIVKEPKVKAEKDVSKLTSGTLEVESAMQRLMTQWGDFAKQVDQTMAGIASSIAENLTQGLTGLINGTLSAKEAFSQMADSIISDIIAMVLRMTIQLALQKAIAGFAGGGGGAFVSAAAGAMGTIAHSGGRVGDSNMSQTPMPKFHQGGKLSSEQVVKVDKGETILTRRRSHELANELAASRGGQKPATQGQGTATIINVLDRREIADAVARNPGAVINAMSRNLPAVRKMVLAGHRS